MPNVETGTTRVRRRRRAVAGLVLGALAATALAGAPAAAAVPTAILRVVVTGPTGEVGVGVTVSSPSAFTGFGTTNRNGVWTIAADPNRTRDVCGVLGQDSPLGGPAAWARTCTRFRLTPGTTTTVGLTMRRGAGFTGHVTDARTGLPVPDASVSFAVTSCCSDSRFADDLGTYRFRNLTPSPTGLRNVHAYGPSTATSDAPWGYGTRATPSDPAAFGLRAGVVTTGIDVRLVPLVRVTGRVLDTAGDAVAGAHVSIRDTTGGTPVDATTNANGAYLLLVPWDIDGSVCAAADPEQGHPAGLAEQCRAGLLRQGTDVRASFRLEGITS